jgi:hypothetical protein
MKKAHLLLVTLIIMLGGLWSMRPAGAAHPRPIHVAILGDDWSNSDYPYGFDEMPLRRLLEGARLGHPDAVFCTGALQLGATTATYSPTVYARQLDAFGDIARSALGPDVPIYPVIGNQLPLGTDSLAIFMRHFSLPAPAPLMGDHLAYTVHVGPVPFIVLATDIYDTRDANRGHWRIDPNMLSWLRAELTANSANPYLFVVGHTPAFTPGNGYRELVGFDAHVQAQRQFWRMLAGWRADAYFCGGEEMYERTNPGGVWQILTGGAAPRMSRHAANNFHHFVWLTLPLDENEAHVQVVDDSGKIRDDFVIANRFEPQPELIAPSPHPTY